MKNTDQRKPEIDLGMISYDKDKDKWWCKLCGKNFVFQADAIRHLSREHCQNNIKGGG